MKGVIEDHYRRTIPVFAGMALKQIKSRRVERKAAQTIYESLIAEWIAREALRKATMIADTDRDDVLERHLRRAWPTASARRRSPRNIRKVSAADPVPGRHRRPHRDARRRHVRQHRERPPGRADLGVKMLKEWLPTKDDRTRPDHAAMAMTAADPDGREVHRRRASRWTGRATRARAVRMTA